MTEERLNLAFNRLDLGTQCVPAIAPFILTRRWIPLILLHLLLSFLPLPHPMNLSHLLLRPLYSILLPGLPSFLHSSLSSHYVHPYLIFSSFFFLLFSNFMLFNHLNHPLNTSQRNVVHYRLTVCS